PSGKFLSRMEAKDGSQGFDFEGTYDAVEELKHLSYTMSDGRKVSIHFSENGKETQVTETFDPEEINSIEMQQAGWRSILENFKKYAESDV
ncbi:MAG TPA: SRPBCC domain-containing protein, partial [Salinimicrobium sp.]|nr:SRPBCC domain-containing protein [Salinimicrobium sp.]